MPQDVVLQDNWLDPTDDQLRYFPVDYQDFWIAADVNSTWNYANNPNGSRSTSNSSRFYNPRFSRQPQPATYHYDFPNGDNPYYGWLVNTYVLNSGLGGAQFGFLCCATDTPSFLANVTSGDYYFLQKGYDSDFY